MDSQHEEPDVTWLAAYAIGLTWAFDSDTHATAALRSAAGPRQDLLTRAAARIAHRGDIDDDVSRRAVTLLGDAVAANAREAARR